jgi:hypothetical protein
MVARTQTLGNRATMARITPIREGIDFDLGSGGNLGKRLNMLKKFKGPATMEGMATINADPLHICVYAGQGQATAICCSMCRSTFMVAIPSRFRFYLYFCLCSVAYGFAFLKFILSLWSPDFSLSPPTPPELNFEIFEKTQRVVE